MADSHYKVIAVEFAKYLLKTDAFDIDGAGLPQAGRDEILSDLYNEFLRQRL